jgi:hypothetical protein
LRYSFRSEHRVYAGPSPLSRIGTREADKKSWTRLKAELRTDATSCAAVARLTIMCLLSSVLSFLACGCESQEPSAMANAYYLSPNKDLRQLGRVALVQMNSDSESPEIAAALTDALFVEIQKKQVFGVMVVRQDDPAWRDLQENLDSLQGLRQLEPVRVALGCNGLLVGTVTRYQPYPHMIVGLRLKLLDLTDGQLLWATEQVWDSSDRTIQKRIQVYSREGRKAGQPSLREELVVVSPLSFSKFVAYEVAGTLARAGAQ